MELTGRPSRQVVRRLSRVDMIINKTRIALWVIRKLEDNEDSSKLIQRTLQLHNKRNPMKRSTLLIVQHNLNA